MGAREGGEVAEEAEADGERHRRGCMYCCGVSERTHAMDETY